MFYNEDQTGYSLYEVSRARRGNEDFWISFMAGRIAGKFLKKYLKARKARQQWPGR